MPKHKFEQGSLPLPDEIIVFIFSFLNVNDMGSLRLASRCFHALIDKSDDYWKYKASFLPDAPKRGLTDDKLRKLILDRHFLKLRLAKRLLQMQPEKKTKNRITQFFSKKSQKKVQIFEMQVDLEEIHDSLLNDDVFKFIKNVSLLKDLTYVDDNAKIEIKVTKLMSDKNIQHGDFNFIPLLISLVIQARAFKCFGICVRFYFSYLEIATAQTEIMAKKNIINPIFSSGDPSFINDFFSIANESASPDTLIAIIIDLYKEKKINGLNEIFNSIDSANLFNLTEKCFRKFTQGFNEILLVLSLESEKQKIIDRYIAKKVFEGEINRLKLILNRSIEGLMGRLPESKALNEMQEDLNKQFSVISDLNQKLESFKIENNDQSQNSQPSLS